MRPIGKWEFILAVVIASVIGSCIAGAATIHLMDPTCSEVRQ